MVVKAGLADGNLTYFAVKKSDWEGMGGIQAILNGKHGGKGEKVA